MKDRPALINPNFLQLSEGDKIFWRLLLILMKLKRRFGIAKVKKLQDPMAFPSSLLSIIGLWCNTTLWDLLSILKILVVLSRGNNSSFITLFPKTKNPLSLNEFHLISLIGCVYKIIAKSLASRLKRVISLIIGETQSSYIELCNWPKKAK